MLGALLGLIALSVWLAFCLARSSRFDQQLTRRGYSRDKLAKFAEKALALDSVPDIVQAADALSVEILGSGGLATIDKDEDGHWRATRADGTELARLPDSCARLLGWFVHNPEVIARTDLGNRRFGAMREILRELMSLYGVSAVLPLVDRGRLLAVIGVPVHRAVSQLDRELLTLLLHEMTAAVANIRLHHQAVHMVSLSREVDLAASIELAMAPEAMDGDNPYLAWAGHYTVAGQAGSDYWGVYPIDRERVMVVVGDAVGRDLAGAMVAAVVKSACDTIFETNPTDITPGKLLSLLNGSLYRPNHQALCTCFAALFDPARSLVHFANAGHEIPYRLARPGGEVQLGSLSARGPLLGEMLDWEFAVKHAPLSAHDTFVFYSNGIVQAKNRSGDNFGNRRLQRLLMSADDHDAGALRDLIYDSVKEFRSGARVIDDEALVVLRAA